MRGQLVTSGRIVSRFFRADLYMLSLLRSRDDLSTLRRNIGRTVIWSGFAKMLSRESV